MHLKEYQEIVDIQIQDFIDEKLRTYERYNLSPRVLEITRYAKEICSAGKRMRPYFVYLSYKACGGMHDDEIKRFALAFEFVHNFALIHDDIIDQGEIRHGVPTYHRHIEKLLSGEKKEHIAMSQAVLMGDLLFAWAQEIIYDTYSIDAQRLLLARQNFQQMLNQLILGEMMDVDAMVGDIRISTEHIATKDYLKTSNYSLIKPMTTGALLAGADESTMHQLNELGRHLGAAYQLKDDLEDLTLLPSQSNKTIFSDIQEGDQTFFTDYIFQQNDADHVALLQSALGKKLTTQQVHDLKKMFESSGAITYGKNLIREHLSQARDIVSYMQGNITHRKQYFLQFMTLLEVA